MTKKHSRFEILINILIVSVLFSLPLYANAQVHPSITIKNIPQAIQDKVIKNYPTLLTEPLTSSRSEKIISAFYETGEFDNIFVSKNVSGQYLIEGSAVKSVASIQIKGSDKISKKTITNLLNIKEGDRFKYQDLIDAAESIKELYAKSGYYNAEISITPSVSNSKVVLQVEIIENEKCIVDEVKFSTAFEDLAEQLNNRGRKFKNKALSEEVVLEVEEVVSDYLKKNNILNASITGPVYEFNDTKTKANLLFSIENPQKFTVFFEGNKYLSSTELLDKLEIGDRLQLSSNPGAEFASKLERAYQSYGFANVQIKYKDINQGQTSSRKLYFTITEGFKVYLRDIRFNGPLSKNQSFYKDIFDEAYDQSIYRQDQVKVALDSVLTSLQNLGYLKSKILSQQANFSEDKKGVELQIYLDEGPQTFVRNISFNGLNAISAQQLKDEIKIQTNTPLSLDALETASPTITNFYRSKGFLDAEVKTKLSETIQYFDNDKQANLIFEIHEGPQVFANKIVIEGNTLTKNHVIFNELEIDEDELLTPQKISDSEYHLQKTGLFSAVEILTLEKGTSISKRTVIVRVQERKPGLVSVGAGVNTEFDFTIRGYTSISYNNIRGTARAVSARAEVKQISDINFIDHNIVLGYLEPTLWAKRTRGRVAFIRAREIFTRTPETKALESNTANFFIEKDFSRYFKLTWNLWSISTNRVFLIPSEEVEERVNIATIGPTIELDKRDHPFVTKKGHFTKFSAELGHKDLGSSDTVHYTRYDSRVNYYRPFKLLNTVWASSLRAGYMYNLEDQSNSHIPEVKQFKLGGRDTIRGFEPNEIPRETDKHGNEVQINTDSYYYLINTEFRIPIYGNVEGVLFYDGGSVHVSGFDFEDNYRDAVGVGFRYQTPVGPLSVEFGYKLDRNKDLDESPYRIHLSFGTF